MQFVQRRSLLWLLVAVASCGGENFEDGRAAPDGTQRDELGSADSADPAAEAAAQGGGKDWLQWAHDERHSGLSSVKGQPLRNIFADVIYDPFVEEEMATTGGILPVHYQVPLVAGNDVYMEEKTGSFSTDTYATQVWHEAKFRWVGKTLTPQWKFTSDWQPPGKPGDTLEPVFHPVIANKFLYVPGAGGTIFKVDTRNGVLVARINPHGASVDPNKYTTSPIVADPAGNLYYNAIELPAGASTSGFYAADAVDAWLVKVTPAGTTSRVSYSTLVANAPAPTDLCELGFLDPALRPLPPPEGTPQATKPCGVVRPPLNFAPAIGADGTIYTGAAHHFVNRHSYLVALNKNLSTKWTASLRSLFTDGCGVPIGAGGTMPPNGAPSGCREGAPLGVDPQTRRNGDGRLIDNGSSTPLVAPDGSIFLAAFTAYNGFRGHTVRFSAAGQYLGAYSYGSDLTPAIHRHGSTYSLVIKDNYYVDWPGLPRDFYITQLSPNFDVEWRFKATNTDHCHRDDDDQVVCEPGDTGTFEWCMNAPAVDKNGTTYAISEDGWLYAIDQGGTMRDRIFLELALGAAYTPASIGPDGKVYAQNAGHLFVAGK